MAAFRGLGAVNRELPEARRRVRPVPSRTLPGSPIQGRTQRNARDPCDPPPVTVGRVGAPTCVVARAARTRRPPSCPHICWCRVPEPTHRNTHLEAA